MADDDIRDEGGETLSAPFSAEAWRDFVRAFRNRNETLIAAGDPAASEATRALKMEALRPEQREHAASVHVLAQWLDTVAVEDEGETLALRPRPGEMERVRAVFATARRVADMPARSGVADALAGLVGEPVSAPLDEPAAPAAGAPVAFATEARTVGAPPRGARRYHQIMLAARDLLLPLERGYPCARGWSHKPPKALVRPYFLSAGLPVPRSGRVPMGVTWHRAGGAGLDSVRRRFASHTSGESRASTHYCIGASLEDGLERYVTIEDRAWHAGEKQTLRWDGRPCALRTRKGFRWINEGWKAARTTIGVTLVGFPEPITRREGGEVWDGVDGKDIIHATLPNGQGRQVLRFSEDQYEMMIAVGREIVERWPQIRPWHHHGHYDICPDYRWDPLGLDFARVLRGVYVDEDVPDVWTPLRHVAQRQRVLRRLCAVLDLKRDLVVDGIWGLVSRSALRAVQRAISERKARNRPGALTRWKEALVTPDAEVMDARARPAYTAVNGYWTTFTNWDAYGLLAEHGFDLAETAGDAAADPQDVAADERDLPARRR